MHSFKDALNASGVGARRGRSPRVSKPHEGVPTRRAALLVVPLMAGVLVATASTSNAAPLTSTSTRHMTAPTSAESRASFVPVDRPGTAFSAAPPRLLKKYGYTEQEFFVTGTACRYRAPSPLGDAQVVDCGYRYKTRMLVRRPANSHRFNGTTAVEWFNTSTGGDIDFTWAATHAYLMRKGYAEVSVSAQVQGLDGIKTQDPARYGDLTLTAPTTDADGNALLGGNEVLSLDVFTQTVNGLRTPTSTNPLPGMKVKHVIALGESQSALRLTDYYNNIDPLYHAIDGMVAYDAFGPLRQDSPTKAISVASELGIGLDPATGLPAADKPNSRRWEVAGASHVSFEDFQYVDPMVRRDGWIKDADGNPTTLTASINGCSQSPAWSTVPTGYVLDSAISHMNRWVKFGTPAPHAPLLERDSSAPPIYNPTSPSGHSAGYATDAMGYTAGGIQLAEYKYPTAEIKGSGTTGPGTCWLTGKHRFYSDNELASRYPHPRAYLAGVIRQTRHNLSAGYIVPSDAAGTIRNAVHVYRKLRHLTHR